MEELNKKQRMFADFYIQTGNATDSYLRAGYKAGGHSAEVNASRLLRNAEVLKYIKERNEQLDVDFIADITETKRFWTELLRDENADMKDRLKASEYIAKTNGAFVDKKEVKGAFDGIIEFGFIDPCKDN
ncbi:terminase small subunit [Neobacillus sp. FSL H8-0543]|uniref:terminase small subunit n=1 Tax=Neobacillus sp. FSL H8-0543 TaxID=2954672 RepID=UPI003158BDB9